MWRSPRPLIAGTPGFPGAASGPLPSPRGDDVTGHLPSHQTRRCRRRFRTAATGRARTPSIGSTRALRPERARRARCSLASPRPAPCRPLRAPSAPSKAGRSPRAIPSRREPCTVAGTRDRVRCEKDASHRLLQPTPVTSTLRIARFPAAPLVAPRLTTFHDQRAGSPWAGAPRRRGGEPAGRLPDVPTRWSFA